jgi:hypothetical protein
MNLRNLYFLLTLVVVLSVQVLSQPTGNIRGHVSDVNSGKPIPNATILIINSNPVIRTNTDVEGNFILDELPVGRYDLRCNVTEYESRVFREILVSSSREVFLDITLREIVFVLDELEIKPKVNKEVALNEMSSVSARMLSVEEASRYAGGFDDPARLTTAFAGVVGGVSSNAISIRGNAPNFLQ